MRKHHSTLEDEAEVDMTPMLDIVFIMLIFFIVTTSFVKEEGIELNRPSNNPQQDQPEKSKGPILFKLSDSNEITIGGRVIDVGAVRANVETEKARKPNAPVVVQASEESDSGIMVQIVDQAKQAGVEKVIVAKPVK